LRELFEYGQSWIAQAEAARRLQQIADVGRSAAYEALKLVGGRFSRLLKEDPNSQPRLMAIIASNSEPANDSGNADDDEDP